MFAYELEDKKLRVFGLPRQAFSLPVEGMLRLGYNTPKYTLVVFDMFRVFCKHNLNVS